MPPLESFTETTVNQVLWVRPAILWSRKRTALLVFLPIIYAYTAPRSETEKQTPLDITYMESKIRYKLEPIYEIETQSGTEETGGYLPPGREGRRG